MKKTILRISAIISAISGMVILAGVFIPILTYGGDNIQDTTFLISPIVDERILYPNSTDVDYSKASNWFEGPAQKEDFKLSGVSYYTISIPRLKIKDATVAIGGEDLSESLIQYPGTALPGKIGNSVIFGHSILPIFYNPKDYMAIFSTLPTLKENDRIEVNYDGVFYTYEVDEMFEVLPSDIQILDQQYSGAYLTLVTCVPPGDPRKPKRLVVRSKIISRGVADANIGN